MSAPTSLEQQFAILPPKLVRPFEDLLAREQIEEPLVRLMLEAGARSGDVSKLLGFAVGYLHMVSRGVPVDDVIRMASQLNRRLNLGWTPRRWREEHSKLSRAVTLRTLAEESVSYDVSAFAKLLPDNWPGYLIRTSRRLGMEGLRQKHCVASYHSGLVAGGYAIAVVFVDKVRWTVQLVRVTGDQADGLRIVQAKAAHNEPPSESVLRRIHRQLNLKMPERQPTLMDRRASQPRYYLEHLQEILPVLRAAEVNSVLVSFDGSGDDGSIWSISYMGGDPAAGERSVDIDMVEATFRDGEWQTTRQRETVSVDKAMEALVYDYFEEADVDWVNNDGGYGDLTVDVVAGRADLLIHQRYTESTCEFDQSVDISTGERLD